MPELYAVEKIRARDLPPIVAFYIEEACNTGLGLTREEKEALILGGVNHPVNEPEFELKMARLLEELKQEGSIADWVPSKRYSPLDKLKVDFIAIRAGTNQAVGLQVTSDGEKAAKRRKKIKELYEALIIPVIHFISVDNGPIEEQKIKNWIATSINENPFFVEINMPEKEAEPLFPASS